MADITPITRLEQLIVDAKDGTTPTQNAITRVEAFLAKIAGANIVTPSPITRIETFLASIAGDTVTLPKPITRIETFLAAIAGEDVETPTPITRVEIFLAEWAEGGGGSVVKTITGEAPLTFEALAAALVSLTQDGKCTQDGTPTPDTPVDIVCNNGTLTMVDDELPIGYKRIASIKFDGDIYYETGEALSGDDDVTMTLDGTSTTGQNIFGSYNGTGSGAVNFSLFIYGGGSSSNSYFRYGDQLLRPRFGSGERTITFGKSGTDGFLTDATATPDTFTTPANAYIGMLPNSTSPPYTGTIVGNITVGTRLKWIPCERESDGAVGYYEAVNGNFIAPTGTGTPTKGAYDYTHAHLEVVGTPEVLSVGTQTASVADLYAVGDYKDTQEIIGGVVKRNVGIKVLDGTESGWALSDSGTTHRFRGVKPSDCHTPASRAPSVCTHFKYVSTGSAVGGMFIGASQYWYFIPTDQTLDDADDWKAWLAEQYAAGTPVIVLYPLAEETTESVQGQALRTEKGTNTVSVTSNVDPVTLTAEYKAEPEPEEVDEP